MRDLYRNLRLDGPVDDAKLLTEAIGQCDDVETVQAAQHVLLSPNRKLVYDCNHRVLSTIGKLRARLSLPQTQRWDALGNHDFDCEISSVWSDSVDLFDLDDDDLFAGAPINEGAAANEIPRRRPIKKLKKTKTYYDPVLRKIIVGGLIFVACVAAILLLLTIIFSLRQPKTMALPAYGTVERNYDATSEKVRITFKSGNDPGYYYIELTSAGQIELAMLLYPGQIHPEDIPAGRYDVRISVGEEEDWSGNGFISPVPDKKLAAFDFKKHRTFDVSKLKAVK